MMLKPETKFRKRFDKKLRMIPNSWWESIQQKTIKATPDKIGCINGLIIALEFKKSANDHPTPLQAHKLELIRKAKGFSFSICPENEKDILAILKRLGDLKMKDVNQVRLVGVLSYGPTHKSSTQSKSGGVTTASLKTQDQVGERVFTTYHNLVAFGLQNPIINLPQQGRVEIIGRLKNSKWTDKNGVDRYRVDVVVNEAKLLQENGFSSYGYQNNNYANEESPF